MTDTPTPAPLDVRTSSQTPRGRISWIWIVPVLALFVILSVAYQTYQDRGVLIEIAFEDGSGITTETPIRYRGIRVGTVEKIAFSDDLGDIVVHARMTKDIAPFLDEDAQFWVVEPNVTLRGVSGLDTVLSGVYIEGDWNGIAGDQLFSFDASATPPFLGARDGGIEILFRAKTAASLARGAPVLHRGLQVGYIDNPMIDPEGNGVIVAAFIEADYVKYVTTNTRFWDTSGFTVSVGANGLALDVDSIASVIEGGIAFDTVFSGGQPVGQGMRPDIFDIFDSEEAARESLFQTPDDSLLTVAVLFDETVNGLSAGAAVKFNGIRVGLVSAINAIVVDINGQRRVRLRTILELSPAQIGVAEGTSEEDAMLVLEDFVMQGLRARLVTGSLLTGSLNIELIEVPDAPPDVLDIARLPYPVIPTTESEVTDVATTAEDVLTRINELPIEELMQGAIDLMAGVDSLVTDGDLRAAPEELLAILGDVRAVIGSDGIQNTPAALQNTLAAIDEAVAGIGAIVQQAEQANLVSAITSTLSTTETFVTDLGDATSALPEVIAQIEKLAAKANALELEALLDQTTTTLANIDTLVASDAVAALPVSVTQSLDEVRALVADVREGGAVDNLNDTLEATRAAALSVETSVEGLPDLMTQAMDLVNQLQVAAENLPRITSEIEALAIKANSVEVDALIDQASATLASIDTLVSSQSTQDLPASINTTLGEINALLSDIREGGAVENVNAALASASQAAQAIETAAQGLPALSRQATRLVDTLNTVSAVYGERGRFVTDTAATLRDIQQAADAVADLARAIQRNPSSLLTGR